MKVSWETTRRPLASVVASVPGASAGASPPVAVQDDRGGVASMAKSSGMLLLQRTAAQRPRAVLQQ